MAKVDAGKRIQATIDSDTAAAAETVIEKLGLNNSVVINALYRRIAATDGIPFSLTLSPEESVDVRIVNASRHIPTQELHSQQEFEDLYRDEE